MAMIAFLGTGAMGTAMIRNLLKAGHAVTAYNRTTEKARHLEADGARVAQTPRAAVAGADMVMSMIIDDNASRACWTGPDGALAGDFRPGVLAVESSSVSRDWVIELGGLAAARGLRFIDCPVAGRPDVAAAGELAVFAGGSPEDIDAARPVLAAIAKAVTRFGPLGAGISFKLIYNVCGTIQVAAIAEAMQACEAAGIDLKVAAAAFAAGATGSPHVIRHSRYMAYEAHEDPVQFSGRNRIKDLTYGIDLMERLGGQSVIGRATRSVFEQMVALGMGDLNDSELIDALRIAHSKKRPPQS
jgi:3-hydroxyisobutyrate dehydrogenase